MSVASTKLTLARVAAIARQDVRELRTLEAPGQGITDTDDLRYGIYGEQPFRHVAQRFFILRLTH